MSCTASHAHASVQPPHHTACTVLLNTLTMLSIAMVPAITMRSPHDSASPYLALMGSSSFLALSRLVLSAQEISGWKRMRAPVKYQTGQAPVQALPLAELAHSNHWPYVMSTTMCSIAGLLW